MAQPAEIIVGSDLFAFASIPPIQVLAYAREVHLALTGPFDSHAVRAAIQSTFDARATHTVPVALPPPPESWLAPCARMALENGLRWTSLDEITQVARAFLDPVLRGEDGTWDPPTWTWRRGEWPSDTRSATTSPHRRDHPVLVFAVFGDRLYAASESSCATRASSRPTDASNR